MTRATQAGLRSPEVAARLGISGQDAYRLLFAGELDGGPDREGIVYFTEVSVEAYLERHGRGSVSNNYSNEPRRTATGDGGRTDAEGTADLQQHGRRRTRADRRHPDSGGS